MRGQLWQQVSGFKFYVTLIASCVKLKHEQCLFHRAPGMRLTHLVLFKHARNLWSVIFSMAATQLSYLLIGYRYDIMNEL